jgi:MFS family permease
MIFFGFESLLGLFTLSQLGLLGSGNALIFLVVGIVLVIVQMRYIGRWSKAYGERKVVYGALAMLAVGLILLSFTPQQPHLFYVREIAENELAQQSQSNTDILIGSIQIQLPDNDNRGVFGVLWALIAIIPLSVGAGLIRPALNSMMTQRVGSEQYGSILGVSSSFVSAANATAPIIGGLLFQQFGATLPFLFGGLLMGVLFIMSMIFISDSGADAQ